MTSVLRVCACVVALAAVVDPAVVVSRDQPIAVEFITAPSMIPLRDRLLHDLHGQVTEALDEAPSAVVILGEACGAASRRCAEAAAQGVPVSIVRDNRAGARDVRVVRVRVAGEARPGQPVRIDADLEANGASERVTVVRLREFGAQLDAREHRWKGDAERVQVALTYIPPAAGVHELTIEADPLEGEGSTQDNASAVLVSAPERLLRILTVEPRPTWMVVFLRRLLEDDPAFAVSAIARPTRGVLVRTASPPRLLTREALEPYDAVLVGAPEALQRAEIEALDWFVRERGGAAVWLPDRRPPDRFGGLLPSVSFRETLLEAPVELKAGGVAAGRASEFAIPAKLRDACVTVADYGERPTHPAVVSCPAGAGMSVFSGALDAWRFRADPGFTRFWAGLVRDVASSARPRVTLTVEPAVVAPGMEVTVRAAVRPSEWQRDGNWVAAPPLVARVTGEDGRALPVRLWPVAETGVFEGVVTAPAIGRYQVEAEAPGRAVAVEPLRATDAVGASSVGRIGGWLAAATGGVHVTDGDVAVLQAHLAELPRRQTQTVAHPMRAPWWAAIFAAALTAEWWLRRRAGDR